MGSWGVGMQAGDEALDCIHGFEQRVLKTLNAQQIYNIFMQMQKEGDSEQGLLGLGEMLLEAKLDISLIIPELLKLITFELFRDRLDCWTEPKERKAALKRFQKRLTGKKVSQKLLDQDNEGLLSKIGKFMG